MESIKILTLNCWGVFVKCATVDKDGRFDGICDLLRRSEADVVLLQEVWVEADFEKLKSNLTSVYPHCVKFYSQVFGSGLCIFCRWPLKSFMTVPYSINGYPHYLHQCDWMSGKSLGYATTVTPGGFKLNLYDSHTIARYPLEHNKDEVEGHRLTQAIELMEFVRATAGSADAIFIGGDLNLEPYTTALRMLKRSLNLKDAWLDQTARHPVTNVKAMEIEGATCERADCPYANKKWTEAYGNGVRLDYIFYRPGAILNDGFSQVTVECKTCQVIMSEVPTKPGLFYSDHAAVTADFVLTRHEKPVSEEIPPVNSRESLEVLLVEADGILQKQMKLEDRRKAMHLVIAGFLLVLALAFGTAVPVENPGYKFFSSIVLLAAGACTFCLIWGNVVGRPCLMNSMRNARNILWNHLGELNKVSTKS